MLFSELYSAYYNAVSDVLTAIVKGEHSEKELQKIACTRAFGESVLNLLPSLKSEKWQLVHSDMTTPIGHIPTMPLTTLQKQWLKAISLDPRVRLFGVEFEGLDGVEPLFTSEDYCVFDAYSYGDPYDSDEYAEHFRTLLTAIDSRSPVEISMVSQKGNVVKAVCIPKTLEYSEKDDKFRLFTEGGKNVDIINVANITSCTLYTKPWTPLVKEASHSKTVTLEILDERNALERCMLHFAHFKKRAENIEGIRYSLSIDYDDRDETELVIRILSFGPLIRVKEPEAFVEIIKERLIRQKNCGLK